MRTTFRTANLLVAISSVLLANSLSAKPKFPQSAEDVLIVDCLLPGQVRKLGRINSFLSPRRPARLSQFDCGLRGGEYVEYDRTTLKSSLETWSAAATGGDVEAMVMVGEALAKGLGAQPDYAQAQFWFQRAADAGDKRAMQNLGHLFELGLGVTADREKALDWYRRASGVSGERVVFTSTLATETQLRAELDQTSQALATEREKRTQAEQQIEQLKADIHKVEADNARKREEVQRLRKEAASAPKPAEVEAMWLVLEEQIRAQEQAISARNSQIKDLERALLGAPTEAAALNPQLQLGTLTLAMIEPALRSSRGQATAAVTVPPQLRLSGRIQPRDRLQQFWVGPQAVEVDHNGLFTTQVAVTEVARIQLSALETGGKRSAFEFTAIATGATLAAAPAAPASGNSLDSSLARPWPSGLKQGKRWLLAIGNRDYQHYTDLGSPIDDAEAVARVFESRYGFSPRILRDATRVDLLLALDEIRRNAGADDDVVIYFAGHGELGKTGDGAWIPVEGKPDDPSGWVPNRVVSDLLATATARNVLVIADSCYSATLSSTAIPALSESFDGNDWLAWAQASGGGRSRMVLSSGGVRPVLDAASGQHSSFASALLKVLERSRGAVEAQRIYREVSDILAVRAMQQPLVELPVYAPLRFGGHQQGELLLAAGG